MNTKDTIIRRDAKGHVKQLLHFRNPYRRKDIDSFQELIYKYLQDVGELLELPKSIGQPDEEETKDKLLRLDNVKQTKDNNTYSFQQFANELPVWEGGITVSGDLNPLRIRSTYSNYKHDIQIKKLDGDQKVSPDQINKEFLKEFLLSQGLKWSQNDPFLKELAEMAKDRFNVYKITQLRPIIYQYDKEKRFHPEQKGPHDSIEGLKFDSFNIPLDPVDDRIKDSEFYEVLDLLFTAGFDNFIEPYNFRIFIEPVTGSIVYARILISHINGYVYLKDPDTKGHNGFNGSSPSTDLDPLRDDVLIEGLDPPIGGIYSLTGDYIKLENISDPNVSAPTSGTDFYYTVPSDDFSAVNAYYLSDKLFRMLSSYDMDINTFFDGTSFPVKVDHRASIGCTCSNGNCKNASAPGNATSDGSDGFRYALVEANTPVGIATAWRVVLHEFGHACLWDNVDSPNFGFCHSMGDSLAVILNDPATQATDRFESFPWAEIGRRHDRDIASGWAFDGSQDDGQYGTEQILSTALFRLYQVTGGDFLGYPDSQELAAKWVVKVILQSVAELAPSSNPANADELSDAMMSSEVGIITPFLGIPGGHLHKVVRWTFEKQGAYLPAPPATPNTNTSEGDPEEIDVYIDDSRNGEYEPMLWNFWNTTDIWNQTSSASIGPHETPVVGVTNYFYVKIKNRGTQPATNITVRAFQCIPGSGLVWPDDWTPMTTASLPGPPSLSPGADENVGPFEWTPTTVDHECLLAIVDADGDVANDSIVTGSIPHFRLVPFDNNIAQRNVAPVAGGGGGSGLVDSFVDRNFIIRNPLEREATVRFEIIQHEVLDKTGFRLGLKGLDIQKGFQLKGRGSREVQFEILNQPMDFDKDLISSQNEPVLVEVRVFTGGLLSGGVSYQVDPTLVEDPRIGAGKGKIGDGDKNGKDKKGWIHWLIKQIKKLFGGKK